MKAMALCAILSEGLSSVLHREIRDKYGLAYHIYADISSFDDPVLSQSKGVCIEIGASMEKKHLKKYLEVLTDVIKNLPDIVTEEDMERIKNGRASREYITAENRADSNYFAYTRYGKIIPYEQRDKMYYDISLREMKSFIRKYLKSDNVSYAMYGPVKNKKPLS
jgi:predicted Zn-dependent peptidase